MRWIAAIFIAAALTIVMVGGWVYFWALDNSVAQITPEILASFGTYFGGVAGPLLAFLTVAGLIVTLLMQNRQIEQVAEANLKDQHVRMLVEIGHDLDAMERQHLDADLTLGDVLNGRRQLAPVNVEAFRALLQRYVKVLGYYAQGVELYRDNVSPYFDCRAFEQRGLRLLDRVIPHATNLGQMGGIAITIIRGHLENTLIKSNSAEAQR